MERDETEGKKKKGGGVMGEKEGEEKERLKEGKNERMKRDIGERTENEERGSSTREVEREDG